MPANPEAIKAVENFVKSFARIGFPLLLAIGGWAIVCEYLRVKLIKRIRNAAYRDLSKIIWAILFLAGAFIFLRWYLTSL